MYSFSEWLLFIQALDTDSSMFSRINHKNILFICTTSHRVAIKLRVWQFEFSNYKVFNYVCSNNISWEIIVWEHHIEYSSIDWL